MDKFNDQAHQTMINFGKNMNITGEDFKDVINNHVNDSNFKTFYNVKSTALEISPKLQNNKGIAFKKENKKYHKRTKSQLSEYENNDIDLK